MSKTTHDAGASEVQAKVDADEAKGYHGVSTDPTPNENYTNRGVGAGLPTPETDDDQADAVAAHQRRLSRGVLA